MVRVKRRVTFSTIESERKSTEKDEDERAEKDDCALAREIGNTGPRPVFPREMTDTNFNFLIVVTYQEWLEQKLQHFEETSHSSHGLQDPDSEQEVEADIELQPTMEWEAVINTQSYNACIHRVGAGGKVTGWEGGDHCAPTAQPLQCTL